jgi:hypothetical protein
VKSGFSITDFNQVRWDEDVALAKAHVGKKSEEYSKVVLPADRQARPWTPCLEALMVDTPQEGERHGSSFLLGRWAMQAGIDEGVALANFLRFSHWKKFEEEEKGITKMLRSLYKSGRIPTLGCKFAGLDRDMMKRHCDPLCQYNDDWSLFG